MLQMSEARTLIAPLFAPSVITEEAVPTLVDAQLFPDERAHIVNAVPKRRAEFGSARVCARKALARLGIAATSLVPHEDRAPRWPEGVVGSISHTHDYCAVAVARSEHMHGIGLDAEQDKELAPDMIAMICTPRERARLARARDAIVYFAAKEAFYKCVYPLMRTFLDFQDVELDLDFDARTFRGRIITPALAAVASRHQPQGRFKRERGLVLCATELPR
jgi:4'-phosphopantetheinyl transferase EntD